MKALCLQTEHTNCVLCLFSVNVILAMLLDQKDTSIRLLLNSELILRKPVVVVHVSFFPSFLFSHLRLFLSVSILYSFFFLSAGADEAEEAEEEKPPATPPGQPVQSPPSSHRKVPPVRADIDRGEPNLADFRKLGLDDSTPSMGLFYYCFPWTEGEDPLRLNPDNTRFARNRITSDVKLDGMTDPKNVKVEVIEPGDKVQVTLCIQDEFLTTRRTVIQVGGRGFGQGGFTDTQAALSNRVTSNQNRLNDLIAEHSGTVQVVTMIDLPKRVESQFTTPDYFGNEGAKKAWFSVVTNKHFSAMVFPRSSCIFFISNY